MSATAIVCSGVVVCIVVVLVSALWYASGSDHCESLRYTPEGEDDTLGPL